MNTENVYSINKKAEQASREAVVLQTDLLNFKQKSLFSTPYFLFVWWGEITTAQAGQWVIQARRQSAVWHIVKRKNRLMNIGRHKLWNAIKVVRKEAELRVFCAVLDSRSFQENLAFGSAQRWEQSREEQSRAVMNCLPDSLGSIWRGRKMVLE